jgi:hypothetical protein
MGTRSITRVFDDGEQIVNMYRQMDGYPSGHGNDLYEFIKEFRFVNGLGINLPLEVKVANGAGCFAAQMVAHFKDEPGSFYLVAGEPGNHGQDYEYQIHILFEGEVKFKVVGGYFEKDDLFEGTIEEFGRWCQKEPE